MQSIQDAKILLVDDNHELLALIQEALNNAGFFHITTADSITSARSAFANAQPDFIVLDVMLPDGDGFSLFRELREQSDIPVLFLSAKDADSDRLFGLGLGADDYLTKPFLTQELILRIQIILRRTYSSRLHNKETTLTVGTHRIDLTDATVTTPNTTFSLTATECTLLQKLIDNRGRIVTYDTLCQAVWGDNYYGYENSLNVHMRHLREKIEENPSAPIWILTVRGLGYKFIKEK